MKFLALELHDEETGQPMRVALNPDYVATVLTFETGDQFHTDDNGDDTPIISVTFELHNTNVIDMFLTTQDARMLLMSLHKTEDVGGEIVFKDIRNTIDTNEG